MLSTNEIPGLKNVREPVSRRAVLAGTAGLAGLAALDAASAAPASAAENGSSYLVGRGISDTTGPVAENGLMGYSMPQQISAGLHMRLRARAFVVVDPTSNTRIAWCVADQAILPVAAHAEIVKRLEAKFPGVYSLQNVNVTCTHTHSAPGGCSHDLIYNLSILGFQKQTFEAFVDGYVEAISRAHSDVKPGSITVGRTKLTNASVNRSRSAFDANPDDDKKEFPGAIDPDMLVMRFKQGGKDVGMISWFSTHGHL